MISRAAFMMQDQLRKNCSLITDIHSPNIFAVRGFLPFPQGLAALAGFFHGKLAADVYSHPYFIEKQSNPSQPSPQLHLTEECQSLMKIIKGLHFMTDDSSKLDNTMVFVSDHSVAARGRMLTFVSEEEEEKEMAAADVEELRRIQHDASSSEKGDDEALRERAMRQRWRKAAAASRNSSSRGGFPFPASPFLRSHTQQSHIAGGSCGEVTDSPHRFVDCDGAHTVLYNPIATDSKTFIMTIKKLHDECRVVKTIVVPTRQGWGGVRAWMEAFPDADVFCSGDGFDRGAVHQLQQHEGGRRVGGCVDMGSGVTGLLFPEVTTGELPDADDAAGHKSLNADDTAGECDEICQLCLRHDPGFGWQDADEAMRRSSRVRPLGSVASHQITPNIELVRVAGDDHTNEYILYDSSSEALACVDLFHGEYGDLDPVNTWMCRVWFKFMKAGNYKRVDIVPHLKWLQVKRHGNLEQLRATVDMLTRARGIKYLLHAHGTPPRIESPADSLRMQWGMPLLR